MSNLVNLEQVHKSFGTVSLLDDVSLGVHTADRIDVVGLDGGGKTTLLEVLTGIEEPGSGRLSGLCTAVVTQRGTLPESATIGDVVLAGVADDMNAGFGGESRDREGLGDHGVAEHEWAADPRIHTVLDGIGIAGLGMDTRVENLSGGERRRLRPTRILMGEPNVLLLDEPNNREPYIEVRTTPLYRRSRPNGGCGRVRRWSRATCPGRRVSAVVR